MIGFGTALFVLLFASGQVARAESITNFQSNTVISSDSVATITETIIYDFGSTSRHGIQRLLELSSKSSTQSGYFNLNYKLISITQDGETALVSESNSGFTQNLKIGDPDTTITGTHRYVLKYQLWPVVREDPDGDYINQNITGNGWQVPILRANAQVTLPAGVVPTQLRCYSGAERVDYSELHYIKSRQRSAVKYKQCIKCWRRSDSKYFGT